MLGSLDARVVVRWAYATRTTLYDRAMCEAHDVERSICSTDGVPGLGIVGGRGDYF